MAMFGVALVRSGGRDGTDAAAWLIKGALVVIATISAVAMPTQNMAVAFTVWIFAAWYITLSPQAAALAGADHPAALRHPPVAPLGRLGIELVAATLIGAFVWVTVVTGREHLRPPMRAVMAQWRYRYGFHPLETDSDDGSPFAWMSGTRAVSVLPTVTGNWLRISVGGGPPDLKARPMHVQIFRGGERVIDLPRYEGEPLTRFLRVRKNEWAAMVEVTTDRTWSPSEFGGSDARRFGVRVETELLTSEQLPFESPDEYPPKITRRIY